MWSRRVASSCFGFDYHLAMSQQASVYQYEALDSSSRDIRLLSILPGLQDDALHLRLRTYPLEDAIDARYDAVSYMWGSADHLHEAYIDGKIMYLRDNIFRFFKHCRDTAFISKRLANLWVDAVCIDQSNIRERGHQVQSMGHIYKNARFVLIWLGRTSEELSLTFESCTYFEQMVQRARADQEPSESTKIDVVGSIERDISLIIRSPYWRRLWIVQEVRSTRFAQIVCGINLVWFTIVSDVAEQISRKQLGKALRITAHELECIALAADSEDLVFKQRFTTLIDKFSKHECSEVRDHVFVVLSLCGMENLRENYRIASLSKDKGFIIDYSTPLAELLLYTMIEYSSIRPGVAISLMSENALEDYHQLSQVLSPDAADTIAKTERLARARQIVYVFPVMRLTIETETSQSLRGDSLASVAETDITIRCSPVGVPTPLDSVALLFTSTQVMLQVGTVNGNVEAESRGILLHHSSTSRELVRYMRDFVSDIRSDANTMGYRRFMPPGWASGYYYSNQLETDAIEAGMIRIPCSFLALAELHGHLIRCNNLAARPIRSLE